MSRFTVRMTIHDALHYTPEQRAAEIAKYPEYMRAARTEGIPQLGSGLVFSVPEKLIACEPFQPPAYWPQLGCMDFGWEHYFAAGRLAWDRDDDVVYLVQCYRMRHQTPVVHAAALRAWGKGLPFAWPKDGKNETLAGAGISLARQYRDHGLHVLPTWAAFPDGKVSVESGIAMMHDRMKLGRFKVFQQCGEFFEEYRTYHRVDGVLVKVGEDMISAVRYGLMMLRHAAIPRPKARAFQDVTPDFDPHATVS